MEKKDINALTKENVIDLIGNQWMLITAGDKDKFNTMTASWGGVGFLWNKPVAFIFVRPERYTHEFIDSNERLTLSFFHESQRKALQICGSKSGRDCDKVSMAGLHSEQLADGVVTFSEARLILVCRKLFRSDMSEADFLDKTVAEKWYNDKPGGGWHTVYVVEIEDVYEQ